MTEQATPQFTTVSLAPRPGAALRTPGFLRVPARTVKPRTSGLLHVLDDGMSLGETRQHLGAAAR